MRVEYVPTTCASETHHIHCLLRAKFYFTKIETEFQTTETPIRQHQFYLENIRGGKRNEQQQRSLPKADDGSKSALRWIHAKMNQSAVENKRLRNEEVTWKRNQPNAGHKNLRTSVWWMVMNAQVFRSVVREYSNSLREKKISGRNCLFCPRLS